VQFRVSKKELGGKDGPSGQNQEEGINLSSGMISRPDIGKTYGKRTGNNK